MSLTSNWDNMCWENILPFLYCGALTNCVKYQNNVEFTPCYDAVMFKAILTVI